MVTISNVDPKTGFVDAWEYETAYSELPMAAQIRKTTFSSFLPNFLNFERRQKPTRILTATNRDQVDWEYMTNVAGKLCGDSWVQLLNRRGR